MADKIRCPKCGTENYSTDPVCLSCGASLRVPQAPAPATPGPVPTPRGSARGTTTKAEEPPAVTGSASATLWLRALGVSLVLTLLEMIALSAITHGRYPSHLWGVQYHGGAVAGVVVWTVIFGVVRTALIGGLLYLTGWGTTVGLLIGGVLGFAGLGTIPGGLVVGFAMGLGFEGREGLLKQ